MFASVKELGVSPKDAVYIGDQFDKDALGASKAGLHGI
ncbi:MAG: HAD hydrolase-like protein [Peptococcaceae bacterium]|nr:HAD hydrolase-like protein [Peptococcaceae bacterium]